MDYWQFLLTDVSEFQLVSASCERLLLTVKDTLYGHISKTVVKTYKPL
jgi:hypothetical protein